MCGPGVITLSPSVGAYKATCRLASQKQFIIDLTVKVLYTRVYYRTCDSYFLKFFFINILKYYF